MATDMDIFPVNFCESPKKSCSPNFDPLLESSIKSLNLESCIETQQNKIDKIDVDSSVSDDLHHIKNFVESTSFSPELKGFEEKNKINQSLESDLEASAIASSCDDEWDSDGRPTGERWAPLGAPDDDDDRLSTFSEFGW